MSWYIRSMTRGRFIGFINTDLYFESDEDEYNYEPMKFDLAQNAFKVLQEILEIQEDCEIVWEFDGSRYIN